MVSVCGTCVNERYSNDNSHFNPRPLLEVLLIQSVRRSRLALRKPSLISFQIYMLHLSQPTPYRWRRKVVVVAIRSQTLWKASSRINPTQSPSYRSVNIQRTKTGSAPLSSKMPMMAFRVQLSAKEGVIVCRRLIRKTMFLPGPLLRTRAHVEFAAQRKTCLAA